MISLKYDFLQASIVAAVFTVFVSLCGRNKSSCPKFRAAAEGDDAEQHVPFTTTRWGWVWYVIVFTITCVIMLALLATLKIGAWRQIGSAKVTAMTATTAGGGSDATILPTGCTDAPALADSTNKAFKTLSSGGPPASLLDVLTPYVDKNIIDQVVAHMDKATMEF